MTQGVKLILRSEEGSILGWEGETGYDLPSALVRDGEDLREATHALFKETVGVITTVENLIPAHRGRDGEYGISSSYVTGWERLPRAKRGHKPGWGTVQDFLIGRWGLFARDAFNKLGWMRRPKLELDQLYKISKRALRDGSEHATEGTDLVLDEILFLMEIQKREAVDDLLREVDVTKVHAEILSTMMSALEEIDGLPSKEQFVRDASAVVEAVDGPRRKIKLVDTFGRVISNDVRGDALKLYRRKAEEFGRRLRAGTLGPGLHRGGAAFPPSKRSN